MNIPFRRVGSTPQEFEATEGNVTLKGSLKEKRRDLVLLNADIRGKVSVPCDICTEQFDIILDEKIDLLISDGVYDGSDDEYDVIEMQNTIDLDEILHSEIELVRSDYHSCQNCKHDESEDDSITL